MIGPSSGALLTQITAGRGLSAATVAIDAAPLRGVLAMPLCSLKAGRPVLGSPGNRHRAAGVTEFVEVPDRGHALTIDDGWRAVAETALTFIRRFV